MDPKVYARKKFSIRWIIGLEAKEIEVVVSLSRLGQSGGLVRGSLSTRMLYTPKTDGVAVTYRLEDSKAEG